MIPFHLQVFLVCCVFNFVTLFKLVATQLNWNLTPTTNVTSGIIVGSRLPGRHIPCTFYSPQNRRGAYWGFIRRSGGDYLGIVNQEHDKNLTWAGGIARRQIKTSNGKAGAGGRHSLSPSLAPVQITLSNCFTLHLTSIFSSYAGINCDASGCNIFELFKTQSTARYRRPAQPNRARCCKPTVCWGNWSKGVTITRWVGVDQINKAEGGGGLLLHLLPSAWSFVFKIARRKLVKQKRPRKLVESQNNSIF